MPPGWAQLLGRLGLHRVGIGGLNPKVLPLSVKRGGFCLSAQYDWIPNGEIVIRNGKADLLNWGGKGYNKFGHSVRLDHGKILITYSDNDFYIQLVPTQVPGRYNYTFMDSTVEGCAQIEK